MEEFTGTCLFLCSENQPVKTFYFIHYNRKRSSEETNRVTDRFLYTSGEISPNIEVLTLTNTEASDLTLRYLIRSMPKIQLIDVRGTKITEAGVSRMKTEYPHVRVVCDFVDWSTDLSEIPPDWWIDREFSFQEEVERPPVTAPAPANDNARNERIEVIFVEPGMVRLRRLVDAHNVLPPLPPQVVVQPIPPQVVIQPLPQQEEIENQENQQLAEHQVERSPPPSPQNE